MHLMRLCLLYREIDTYLLQLFQVEDYKEQRNITRNFPVRETTIQRGFACEEFGSRKAMKTNFEAIKWKSGSHIDAMDS